MLGLSGGITSVSAPGSRVLLETYTADWSSNTDGWESYGANDAAATLTHGITFEGKSNALRVQFNADPEETNLCGIYRTNPFSTDIHQGDLMVLTYDIHLDSAYDSLTDLWEGVDAVSNMIQITGQVANFFAIAQDTWVSVDTSADSSTYGSGDLVRNTGNDSMFVIFNSTDDSPQNGARFYLHNLVAKLYRSQIFT